MPSGLALLFIPLVPLCAALALYALPRLSAKAAGWLGAGSMLVSSWLTVNLLLLNGQRASISIPWLYMSNWLAASNAPGQNAATSIPLAFDAGLVELLFLLTTALISVGVMLYAMRDRQGDPRARQFCATLTLFGASMLLFIAADTLLVMYIAWELMGLCSYVLISHHGTQEALRAARQAFWTTRATDTGLLFAILILMTRFQVNTVSQLDIAGIMSRLSEIGLAQDAVSPLLGLCGMLVLFACLGKAAQLPLSFWLPDAMVAPAPVSALLHAATMVAAGPFLIIRFFRLIYSSQDAMLAAVLLGGITLVLGGVMALCADDPKRILAYSTVSQLGLVILSVGVLAEEAGMYHLLAHAWFKAALFLGVGYVVTTAALQTGPGTGHAAKLHELAGAARAWPVRLTLILAGLSLAGVACLGGALGKEQVLHALLSRAAYEPQAGYRLAAVFPLAAKGWQVGVFLFLLALPITAAYSTRLIATLCFGKPQGSPALGSSNQPAAGWRIPLFAALALAVMGSIGWALAYMPYVHAISSDSTAWKWGNTLLGPGLNVLLLSQALVWISIAVTWLLLVAQPDLGRDLQRTLRLAMLAQFFREGMYLREFFRAVVGGGGTLLAILAGRVEVNVIDWLALRCGRLGRWLAALSVAIDRHVVDGVRYQVCELCLRLKRLHSRALQTGSIQHYMFVILISTALLCLAALRPLCLRLVEFFGRM